MKKLKTFLMVGLVAICGLFAFTACDKEKQKESTVNPTLDDANVYITSITRLKDIEIRLGENDTKGEIEWADEDQIIQIGEREYAWEFEPEDDDYKPVTGKIKLTGYRVYDISNVVLSATVDYSYNGTENITFSQIDYNKFNVSITTENIYSADNDLKANITAKGYSKILGDSNTYLSTVEKDFDLTVDFSDVTLDEKSLDYTGSDVRADIDFSDVINTNHYTYNIVGENGAYTNAGNYEDVNVQIVPKNSNITVKYGEAAVTSKTFDLEIKQANVLVDTYAKLASAIANPNVATITLTSNITNVENNELLICAYGQNINKTINLNGYNIEASIKLGNRDLTNKTIYNNTCNVTITNTNLLTKSKIGKDGNSTGIKVFGDNKTTITLNNVDCFGEVFGLSTNGYCEGSTINATNCSFTSTIEADPTGLIDGVGAFLPAYYTCNFVNCEFEGGNGVYTKSGENTFINCTITGTSKKEDVTYNGSGCNITGDAIVVDATYGYHNPLNVMLEDCKLVSTNGYLVQEAVSDKNATMVATYTGKVVILDCVNSEDEEIAESDVKWETKGAITLNNQELNVALCGSLEELQSILDTQKYDAIKLTADITGVENNQLYICAYEHNVNLVIDLNGYDIKSSIRTGNFDMPTLTAKPYTCKLSIINTSSNESYLGTENTNFGLFVVGNESTEVILNNVELKGCYYALVSNGYCSGATITAANCSFIATPVTSNDSTDLEDSAGAFLPAYYTCSFVNCEFEGGNGVYIKSGENTFTNCIIRATSKKSEPKYNGSGFEVTGDAVVVDATYGYHNPLNVTLTLCMLESKNGYLVQEVVSDKNETDKATYTGNVVITNCINGQEESVTEEDLKWETDEAITLNGTKVSTKND